MVCNASREQSTCIAISSAKVAPSTTSLFGPYIFESVDVVSVLPGKTTLSALREIALKPELLPELPNIFCELAPIFDGGNITTSYLLGKAYPYIHIYNGEGCNGKSVICDIMKNILGLNKFYDWFKSY